MKKVLLFIDHNFEIILMYLAAAFLISSVILQVVSRAVMMPISWTEELARYAFVWLTFFGIGFGVRYSLHTRFELFDHLMPQAAKDVLAIFYSVVGLAVWGLVLYVSVDFIKFTALTRAPALNTTILVRNLSVLIGGGITLIRLVQRLGLDIMHLIITVKDMGGR